MMAVAVRPSDSATSSRFVAAGTWVRERLMATDSLTPRSAFQIESSESVSPSEVPTTQPGLAWLRESS